VKTLLDSDPGILKAYVWLFLVSRSTTLKNIIWGVFNSSPAGPLGRLIILLGQLLDNFHPYPVEQNGSDCWQATSRRRDDIKTYCEALLNAIVFVCR